MADTAWRAGPVEPSQAWLDTPAVEQPGAIPPAQRNLSLRVSLGLLAIVLVVGLVFVIESDSWYLFWKVLHILAAVVWVGGGLAITLLVIRTERSGDTNRLVDLGEHADWISKFAFVPSSLLVIVTGIAATINGDLDWDQFWIIFGLIAWGTSAAIGIGYITPRVSRLSTIASERGPTDPDALLLLRNVTIAARVDLAFLLLVVIDMTVKPFS
jgi:uncharacterized membrane protein